MAKTDLLTCHQVRVKKATIRPYWHKLYCSMKVIPQYKVIGPYNYGRITHNIKKC